MSKTDFGKVVRAEVARVRPTWRFEGVASRVGTCVDFALPPVARRFATSLFFHEEFTSRKTLVPTVRADVRTCFAGKQHAAEVAAGDTRAIAFRDADELRVAIGKLVPLIERLATNAKRHVRHAARLAKLFDRLDAHFARWLRGGGGALPPSAFDEAELAEPAFVKFQTWLAREGLLAAAWRPTLWHWWRDGDPTAPATWGKQPRLNDAVRAAIRS